MRVLTFSEISQISAGQNYPSSGETGWNNYRNPVKMPQDPSRPEPGEGLGEHVGDILDNPFSFVGSYLDFRVAESRAIFHNQMFGVVNRDRNGDGRVTDQERQDNWDDFWTRYEPGHPF